MVRSSGAAVPVLRLSAVPRGHRWAALAVLCASALIVNVDNTILSVALPSLVRKLAATSSELQWIVDSYAMVFAGLLLVGSSLADRFGRKRFLLIGLGVFAAGSVGAAFSGSVDLVIGWRAVMGADAALTIPASLSIINDVFRDPAERGPRHRRLGRDHRARCMTSWCVGWPRPWRNARPAEGPCFRVSSDVTVRFADAASSSADRRLNVRYPDIVVRDCDPYDVNTAQDHIQLIVEVTSEATVETDTTAKRLQYAAAGVPGYLVIHFDKGWARISEIEEYRLDWCGRRYVAHAVHRRALILDERFASLWRSRTSSVLEVMDRAGTSLRPCAPRR